MEKEYKALWVTPELHQEIKLAAVKKGVTIIEFVQYLMSTYGIDGILKGNETSL